MEEDEEAFGAVLCKLCFEPGALRCAQRGIHNLGVEDDGVDGAVVKAIPGRADAAVVEVEDCSGDRMGRHGRVGFVADVVVAGDKVRFEAAGCKLV